MPPMTAPPIPTAAFSPDVICAVVFFGLRTISATTRTRTRTRTCSVFTASSSLSAECEVIQDDEEDDDNDRRYERWAVRTEVVHTSPSPFLVVRRPQCAYAAEESDNNPRQRGRTTERMFRRFY